MEFPLSAPPVPPDSVDGTLRTNQHRILLITHAALCSHKDGCCTVPNCANVGRFLQHIEECKVPHCRVPHCMAYRDLYPHFLKCTTPTTKTCPICLTRKANENWGTILEAGLSRDLTDWASTIGHYFNTWEGLPDSFPATPSPVYGGLNIVSDIAPVLPHAPVTPEALDTCLLFHRGHHRRLLCEEARRYCLLSLLSPLLLLLHLSLLEPDLSTKIRSPDMWRRQTLGLVTWGTKSLCV